MIARNRSTMMLMLSSVLLTLSACVPQLGGNRPTPEYLAVIEPTATTVATTRPTATDMATVEPSPTPVTLLAPDNLADEWPVDTPDAHGLDPNRIHAVAERLQRGEFGLIYSLVIARHGNLVYERYFYEESIDQEDMQSVYAVGNSITSALIGIASEKGMLGPLDQRIVDVMPDYEQLLSRDPRLQQITLRHLLMMTSGIEWEESTIWASDREQDLELMYASDNWFPFVLEQPLAQPPGTAFAYNSGGMVLMGGVLQQQTGVPVDAFAEEHLFEPLGITRYSWRRGHPLNRDSNTDVTDVSTGLWMRPRDLAKFGQLYADNGRWQDQQIIPADWITESTDLWVSEAPNGYLDSSFGLQWWLPDLTAFPQQDSTSVELEQFKDTRILLSYGYGGQHLFVIPEYELVIVITADSFGKERLPPLPDLLSAVVE